MTAKICEKTIGESKVDKELTRVVNKDASILSTPNFVSSDFWIASSSLLKKTMKKKNNQSCTMRPEMYPNVQIGFGLFFYYQDSWKPICTPDTS